MFRKGIMIPVDLMDADVVIENVSFKEMSRSRNSELNSYITSVQAVSSTQIPQGVVSTAYVNGEVGGAIAGSLFAGDPSKSWIMSLGVGEPFRRQGLAVTLIAEIIDHFRSLNVSLISLTIEPENEAALNLYLSLGFVRAGFVEDFFTSQPSRIILSKSLTS